MLPAYAYWKFDDFSWGDTRKTAGEKTKKAGLEYEGEFDSSKITMKRWHDFEAGEFAPLAPATTGRWANRVDRAPAEGTECRGRVVTAVDDIGRRMASVTARIRGIVL